MVDVLSVFFIFSSIIFIGYFAELLFKKTRIPDVLFLMATGILLSTVLKVVKPEDFGLEATLFINFALIYLLFQGSLNLDFKTLFASFKGSAVLTIISFVLTTIIVATLAILIFKLSLPLAILLGITLGGTSSAVVIPLVSQLPISKNTKSILTLESAISDVLSIVGALTIITIIKTGTVSGTGVISSIIGSFSIAIVLGLVAGLIWMILLAKNKNLANTEMVTVAIVVLLYTIVQSDFIGASGAIAVLAFGLVLGNAKSILKLMYPKSTNKDEDPIAIRNVISNSAKNFFTEISFFVKVFFFVYLGILMDFSEPTIFLWGFIITLFIYLFRPLAVKIAFRKHNLDFINKTSLEVLIPKGLAAAVIIQLAVSEQIPGAQELVSLVFSIILISILLTGILIFLNGQNRFNGFEKLFSKQK